VYLQRGYIDPGMAFPVVLGVLGGAFTGARLLTYINARTLRIIFCAAITFVALEMIYNGLNHQF
jgi:uncharacterized membrane protein YfcA